MGRKAIGSRVTIILDEDLEKELENSNKKSTFLRNKLKRDTILAKLFDMAIKENNSEVIKFMRRLPAEEIKFLVNFGKERA